MAEYVGRTIAKTFPGFGKKKFRGQVSGIRTADGVQLFKIKYEDGDEEELELEELSQVLLPKERPQEEKPKGKRKRAEEETATNGAGGTRRAAAKKATPGQGREAVPAPASLDDAQLRDIVDEVAVHSKELEANVTRLPAARQAADEAHCSRAATCRGICWISSLRPTRTGPALEDGADVERVNAEYRSQVTDVLRQLDATLQEVGSSKDHLLQVTALLKDVVAGRAAWVAVWNAWANRLALPALTVQESYLGCEETLISLSAVAAVPGAQYA